MSKKYKAILFDYDGTLVDTNQLIVDSWNHMYMAYCGGELTKEDVVWTFGIPLRDGIDGVMKIKGHSGYDLDELTAAYRSYQADLGPDAMAPFPGVCGVLKELKARGAKLGIVTSRQEKSCMEGLKWYGLCDLFDRIVTAETTPVHKPGPEPALLCLRGLGVDPADAIMVGDSVFDLQCGNNAGCDSCFVAWSFATSAVKAVAEGSPTMIVDSPEQFLDLI